MQPTSSASYQNKISTPNTLLCTLDVGNLYTNISHQEVIKAIREALAI